MSLSFLPGKSASTIPMLEFQPPEKVNIAQQIDFKRHFQELEIDGIDHQIDPGDRCDNNSYTNPLPPDKLRRLPANLLDALRCLETNPVFAKAFGKPFIASYLKLKQQQWHDYSNQITQWELNNTLDC
ncbi:MAG: hypothetical protein WA865_08780 [Spirulinaceae cyanobacterium]